MIGFIIKKIIGSKNDREVRRLRPLVARINEMEASLQPLPDDSLREKTAAWKERLSKIEDKEELAAALGEILPEAFAVVKNACRRLSAASNTTATSPTARTRSSVSITCATMAWPRARRSRCSAAITTPSWMKWTRS